MNVEYYIRQLKLYDILGYSKDPKVELLVKHINKNFLNLTIKEDDYWYNQNNEIVIYQNLKNNVYYIKYDILWSFFSDKLMLVYLDVQALTKYILETHYKLKGITTISGNYSILLNWKHITN